MVLITRLAKQVYRHSDEELLGMHLRHLGTLSYLRDFNGAPQQELAEAFCMDANNVVLLLNELEQQGHVTRRRDPDDRRRHLVEITDEGRRALARAELAQEQIEDHVLQALDAQERATLWQLLTRALYGAEAPVPEPADDDRVESEAADNEPAELAAPAVPDDYSATTASIST
jgi:DNA-binding MarR family transcriptional regulator